MNAYTRTRLQDARSSELWRARGCFQLKGEAGFGDLTQSAAEINAGPYYIQQRCVKTSIVQELDALVAALANFCFHMAVEGRVTYLGKETKWFGLDEDDIYRIELIRVGVYVRDSYDFIGSQLGGLGYWNPTTNGVSKIPGAGFHKVVNETFRDWRAKTGCGGDFIVYSDIEVRDVSSQWEVRR
jgi:hypothetical protein